MAKAKNGKAVGYGNPPTHSQYQKGQSGNPKGRPKGTAKVDQLIKKLEKQKVVVIENGQKKKMNKIELILSAMFSKASKGDVQAAKLLLSLKENYGQSDAITDHGYSEADLTVLLEEADWQAFVQHSAKSVDPDGE